MPEKTAKSWDLTTTESIKSHIAAMLMGVKAADDSVQTEPVSDPAKDDRKEDRRGLYLRRE